MVLSKIHPVLIIETNDPNTSQNLLAAFGKLEFKNLKTISASKAFNLIGLLVNKDEGKLFSNAQMFINMRNEELHSGSTNMSSPPPLWEGIYWTLVKKLFKLADCDIYDDFLDQFKESGIPEYQMALFFDHIIDSQHIYEVQEKIRTWESYDKKLQKKQLATYNDIPIDTLKEKIPFTMRHNSLNFHTDPCPVCTFKKAIVGYNIYSLDLDEIDDLEQQTEGDMAMSSLRVGFTLTAA